MSKAWQSPQQEDIPVSSGSFQEGERFFLPEHRMAERFRVSPQVLDTMRSPGQNSRELLKQRPWSFGKWEGV